VTETGSNDQARPELKPGRAYLQLAITDKDGNRRIVDCEADIVAPRLDFSAGAVHESQEFPE
jgi:hypothetical protein